MGREEGGGESGEGVGREGERAGMWRGPESGLPRGPRWLSAGLVCAYAAWHQMVPICTE